MLEGKALNKENAERYDNNASAQITLSFDEYETKIAFCEILGVSPEKTLIKGEDVLAILT